MKNIIKCPICDKKTTLFAQKKYFQIYRCSVCGLGITKNSNLQKGNYHRDSVYIEEENLFRNIFERRFRAINKIINTPGKILEIGSSTGILLSLFKERGWEVLGVEMSSPAAKKARERGIPTLLAPFEKVHLEPDSFDVVVINHTLEHVQNPVLFIKKLKTLLKREGILLIDVPNFGSLSAAMFKSCWKYLLPDEHLWHFTVKSLRKLLIKNNFQIISAKMPSGIWDYGHPLRQLLNSLLQKKKSFVKDFLTVIPTLVVTKMDKGTDLTLIAKKR